MRIREITTKDIPALAALYVEVFAHPPWNEVWQKDWAVDRLEKIYQSPGFFGLVFKQKGECLGAVLGRTLPFKGQDEFELVEFYVAAHTQGRGIGKELLSMLEKTVKKRGCAFCTLLTARGSDAQAFYSKQGYRTSEKMGFMIKGL